jgi:hypothetical protein
MEHGQNNDDKKEKIKVPGGKLSHSQSVHQKFKVDWPRSNPGLRVPIFKYSPGNPPVRRSHLMVGRQGATVTEK